MHSTAKVEGAAFLGKQCNWEKPPGSRCLALKRHSSVIGSRAEGTPLTASGILERKAGGSGQQAVHARRVLAAAIQSCSCRTVISQTCAGATEDSCQRKGGIQLQSFQCSQKSTIFFFISHPAVGWGGLLLCIMGHNTTCFDQHIALGTTISWCKGSFLLLTLVRTIPSTYWHDLLGVVWSMVAVKRAQVYLCLEGLFVRCGCCSWLSWVQEGQRNAMQVNLSFGAVILMGFSAKEAKY